MADEQRMIRAAGGVVWRHAADGLEVALVHRPRYDDWSLPKGKLKAGESTLAAAVREVGEELGSRVAVSRRLSPINYDVDAGPKQVDFWVMRHLGGDFEPDEEVDDVRWLPLTHARAALTHAIEQEVLDEAAARQVPDAVVVLVRHARAGNREDWDGDDELRPLDPVGREQAIRLGRCLGHFAPEHIVAAPPVRCRQTVEPLATSLGLPIAIEDAFADDVSTADPRATDEALRALAGDQRVTIVCSQGETIPALIERFAPSASRNETAKGSSWVLSFACGHLLAADHYPAP